MPKFVNAETDPLGRWMDNLFVVVFIGGGVVTLAVLVLTLLFPRSSNPNSCTDSVVSKVEPNSPFSSAIKVGDCIIKVNSDVVVKDGRLDHLVLKHYPKPITFLVKRDNQYIEVK